MALSPYCTVYLLLDVTDILPTEMFLHNAANVSIRTLCAITASSLVLADAGTSVHTACTDCALAHARRCRCHNTPCTYCAAVHAHRYYCLNTPCTDCVAAHMAMLTEATASTLLATIVLPPVLTDASASAPLALAALPPVLGRV